MLKTLDTEFLATVSGGMQWENFRRSTNIEDRRGPKGGRPRHRVVEQHAPDDAGSREVNEAKAID